MARCDYCEITKENADAVRIYEDNKVVAILSDKPAAAGHIILMPKEHYPIIEQVPNHIISHLFIVANKLSISAFEGLNAFGTNILINNGVAAGQTSSHFMVHIIPRREGDNLNFNWQPKKQGDDELANIQLLIKEQALGIGNPEHEKTAPAAPKEENTAESEDYLTIALDRIP